MNDWKTVRAVFLVGVSLLAFLASFQHGITLATRNGWAVKAAAVAHSVNTGSEALFPLGEKKTNTHCLESEREALYTALGSAAARPQGLTPAIFLCEEAGVEDRLAGALEQLQSAQPLRPVERYILGLSYLRLNKTNLAVAQFRTLSDLEWMTAYRGQVLLDEMGNVDLAKAYFALSEAIRPEVSSNRFQMYRGQCQLALAAQTYSEALRSCGVMLEAASSNKERATGYHHLGRVALDMNDFIAAEAHFRAALTLDPGNADHYFWIGLLHERQHKVSDAINWYQKAIALDHAHTGAINSLKRLGN